MSAAASLRGAAVRAVLGAARLGRPRPGGYVVLAYHNVYRRGEGGARVPLRPGAFVEVSELRRQLEWLRRQGVLLSVAELVSRVRSGVRPAGLVAAVTFDDGYRDNGELAVPLLRELGIPATFFVPSAFALGSGGGAWWDSLADFAARHGEPFVLHAGRASGRYDLRSPRERLRFVEEVGAYVRRGHPRSLDELREAHPELWRERAHGPFLSAGELRAIGEDPLFEIGAHTETHPVLSALEDGGFLEMTAGRAQLEEAVGRPVRYFAYPFGDPQAVSPAVVEAARRAGFEAAFTLGERHVRPGEDPAALPRVGISGSDSPALFELKVRYPGLVRAMRSVRRGTGGPT